MNQILEIEQIPQMKDLKNNDLDFDIGVNEEIKGLLSDKTAKILKNIVDKKKEGSVVQEQPKLEKDQGIEINEDTNLKKFSNKKMLKKLLLQFDLLNCDKFNKPSKKFSEFLEKERIQPPSFCTAQLKNVIYNRLHEVDYSPLMMFNWMNTYLYKPLGLKMYRRITFPRVLNDFLEITKKDSMIHAEMHIPTLKDFKKGLLKSFEQIEQSSSNFEENKNQLSNLILDVLKKFHMYWNVMRQRKQMANVHQNTFDMMKSVVERYIETSNSMRLVSYVILNNIKTAYQRFVKADTMKHYFKQNASEIVAEQILKRYKNNLERIHMKSTNYINRTMEIVYLLDLLRAFFLINHNNNIQPPINRKLFKKYIFNKIIDIYKEYYNLISIKQDKSFYDFKDFTATILLKMEVRVFKYFEIKGLEVIVNTPPFTLSNKLFDSKVDKIYFVWQDNMLILPLKCLNTLNIDLRKCLVGHMGLLYQMLYHKYRLFNSIAGNDLMSFLKSQNELLVKNIISVNGFENYSNMRNIYYAELFKFTRNFQAKYRIKEVSSLDKLNIILGAYFEKIKSLYGISSRTFHIIDKLDKALYTKVLEMKSLYNDYAPLKGNSKIYREICDKLLTTVKNFEFLSRTGINNIDKLVLNHVSTLIKRWTSKSIHSSKSKLDGLNTASTIFMPDVPKGSILNKNFVYEPNNASMKTHPIYIPA